MRDIRMKSRLWLFMAIMLIAIIITPTMNTFAGEINGEESRVIAAASGTFSYNGKTYRAGSAHINSLVSYLSGDDVDLTAEQASEAISLMYESIEQGITEGYLYEVNEETSVSEEYSENTSSSESKDNKEETKEEQTTKSKDKDKETTTNRVDAEEPTIEGDTSTDSEVNQDTEEQTTIAQDNENETTTEDKKTDVWEGMSAQTESKNKLEQRPDKDDAKVQVELENDNIIITTDDDKIQLSKQKQIIPNKVVVIINIVSGVISTITIICGIVLFTTKCMSFRKRRGRRSKPGHSRRRRIRHNVRNILICTTAISIFGVFLLISIYVSMFHKDDIMKNMQNSGYFRYAYAEYIAENAGKSSEEIECYRDYLFFIKQNTMNVLDGKSDIVIPDSNVAPYIYNLKQSYMKMFYVGGLLTIFNVIAGIILMIYMDQRRERGIKSTAVAELCASAVMLIITVFATISKPYLYLYIEPDYLYLFMVECIKRSIMVMTCVSAFGIVLGMILIGTYRGMLKKKDL